MCSLPYSLGVGNPWNHQELCRPHVGGRKESETTRRMRQDRNVEGNGETWVKFSLGGTTMLCLSCSGLEGSDHTPWLLSVYTVQMPVLRPLLPPSPNK